LSNSRGSKLSPCTARACRRACSKASRNSFWSISSRCHSIVTGHHDGADCHHFGGAPTLAEHLWFCWNRYCSMPKKANGMQSSPRITMAIQPEVFSRSFCSIGQERRDEAGQFTRNGGRGPHPAPARTACGGLAQKKRAPFPAPSSMTGGVDGTRTRDLRRDRPAF